MGVKLGLRRYGRNTVLRKIFGLKGDEIISGWREFPNEELLNLHSSSDISRMNKHVARMHEKRNAYKILAGKPERKRPLGRPRHRWEMLKWMLER
jgi:hypothetical protein